MADADQDKTTTSEDDKTSGKGESLVSRGELEKVIEQRQAAKAELRELRDWKARKEAEEKAAQEDRMLEEKRYQELLAEREKDLDGLRAELDRRDAAEAARAKGDRRSKFLDAIESKSGLSGKRAVMDGLLSVLERDGLDSAPEEVTDRNVRDVLERMQALDKDTFAPKDLGPKGSPGTSSHVDVSTADQAKRVEELAKRLSWRGSKTG